MRLPQPRGPLSERLFPCLRDLPGDLPHLPEAPSYAHAADVLFDEDVQITLWSLYELHHAGFDDVDDRWEFAPGLMEVRARLEGVLERALREAAAEVEGAGAGTPLADADELAAALFAIVAGAGGPSVPRFVRNHAERWQVEEMLIHRSIYTLKEADLHTWVIPRLQGGPKVSLVELQYDEYGAGSAARQHARMFADTLRASGLSDEYGAYIDAVPAITLAVNNMMTLFGLHRRLRGAAMGHLAAFEATSSLPARDVAAGLERLGLSDAAPYFVEHVEADAVHEQVAMRDICGELVRAEPTLLDDVVFGLTACLALDDIWATAILDRWSAGTSSLRRSGPAVPVRSDQAMAV